MSAVLYGIGGLALIVGIALAGFGIPVSEFSFGNTLIMAGATVGACGLIVIALAAVTAQLQQLNDLLGHGAVVQMAQEQFEAQEQSEPQPTAAEPRGPAVPPEFPMPAPLLRNPEQPPQVEEEEASLSPERSAPMPVEEPANRAERSYQSGWPRPRPPTSEPPAQPRQRSTFFDSMWPADNKMLGRTGEQDDESRPAEVAEPEMPPAQEFADTAPPPTAGAEVPKPRAVAILKSGVVDGMSYTLYVDGSIEAELPQGTLRFASIHELRAHLEQNG